MLETEVFHKVQRWTPSLDWERLENSAGSGTFDTVVGHRTGLCWVEFKVRRTKSSEPVDCLRPSQRVWVRKKLLLGQRHFLLILTDGPQADYIWLHMLYLDEPGQKLASRRLIPPLSWKTKNVDANILLTGAITLFISL